MTKVLSPYSDAGQMICYGDDAARFNLVRELRPVSVVARFTVTGEPVSKARARFTGYGSNVRAYTPEKTKTAEEKMAWLFRQAAPGHKPDSVYTYGICAIFVHGTRQRRDVDNMLKLVSDALNGVAWADDVQVEEVSARRGYDLASPRTEVLIYRIGVAERGPVLTCDYCGKNFKTYRSWTRRKYCTKACETESRRSRRVCICKHCGKTFDGIKVEKRPDFCSRECALAAKRVDLTCVQCGTAFVMARSLATAQHPLCSDECQAVFWREKRRSRAVGTCATCGGPTSKKTYTNCRPCSHAIRAKS